MPNLCGILLFLINLQQVASFISSRPAGRTVYTYQPLQSYTKSSVDEELQSSELLVEEEEQNNK